MLITFLISGSDVISLESRLLNFQVFIPQVRVVRAQRKGLRAQKNGIRDHKAFEPESGIRFITRYKNLLSQYFPLNKVCVHSISWPRFITYSCFRLAAVPVI